MVLLEIDKAYPGHERLLGEHRWIEFWKNPRADEKERISQIFYCLYDTGRAAQKDGTFPSSRCCLFCYDEAYVRDTERMEAHTRRKPLVQRLESK